MLGLGSDPIAVAQLVAEIKLQGLNVNQAYELVYVPMQKRCYEFAEQGKIDEVNEIMCEMLILSLVAFQKSGM